MHKINNRLTSRVMIFIQPDGVPKNSGEENWKRLAGYREMSKEIRVLKLIEQTSRFNNFFYQTCKIINLSKKKKKKKKKKRGKKRKRTDTFRRGCFTDIASN